MQDCPIFFIQQNYVDKNKVLPLYVKFPCHKVAQQWEFHFLLINEAMQGKHWEEDAGLLGLLSRAIVPTV